MSVQRDMTVKEQRYVSAQTILILIAIAVGIASGLFSVLFYLMIRWVTGGIQLLAALGPVRVVLYAMLGGMVVGPLVYFSAREAKGHGVPEVMHSVALNGGRIRPRVVVIKALASAITIGTGGSAGREGPIVQIGAAIGSAFGQALRLSEDRAKTLVACGAAAGIAATFNAPIAGAVFALEVILGEFAASTFGLVVISSVSAAVVARAILGSSPAFIVVPYDLVSIVELNFYAVLGLAATAVAQLYIRFLYKTEDFFDALRIPEWSKPILGGLLFGLLGLLIPQSLGRGDEVMAQALKGLAPLSLSPAGLAFFVLALVKILSTSLTIGSGGSGGVFFPGLFIGAMTGGAVGSAVHTLYPGVTASPGAYALVGMGAVFAGMTQAPITAILMLFEMTQDYRIILPLMLSCVIASLVSGLYSPETIYTLKLRRRGIDLKQGKDVNILRKIRVAEAMERDVETVREDMTLGEVIVSMQRTNHTGYPVLDLTGHLVGMITLEDIRHTDLEGRLKRRVREVMTRNLAVSHPAESIEEASRRMAFRDIGRLPVVDGDRPEKLVGIITRSDVIKAYNRGLIQTGSSVRDDPARIAQ